MKLTQMHVLLLGVVVLAPFWLRAQDPTMPPSSQTNPLTSAPSSSSNHMSPGVTRSSGVSASDSSLNGNAASDAQTMKDKMFLVKAGLGGLAEMRFGQLAVEKASAEDVKRFASRMVADHTMMNNTMKPIAESLGVSLPTKMGKGDQAEYDKLKLMSGAEFDNEYLGYMTKDHQKDLMLFTEEESATADQALKEAVTKGQHVIAKHTRIVEKLDSEHGVTVNTASK